MSQGSTSDYSSLSPDLTSQSSSSRDDNLNITSTTESASQRSSSPEKESLSQRSSSPTDNIDVEEVDLKKEEDENSEKLNKHSNNDDVRSENTCDTDNDASVKTRGTCQADSWTRDARDKFKSNPRRHSWAGGRLTSVGIPKQTSLQDFKKLLAQKTPSQSTNKTSAVQLLTKIESTSTEPFHSSQVRDDNGIGDTFEVNTILTD